MEKTCKKCGAAKETDNNDFRVRTLPSGKAWINTTCRECERESNRTYHKEGRRDKEKKATYMKQWVQDNKEHVAQKGRERYERIRDENPEYFRHVNLRSTMKKYGLTEDDYFEMFEQQEGKCAICRKEPGSTMGVDKNRLVIDHDHADGKVRALLCDFCNRGIGMFFDSPDLLVAAADYLQGFEEVVLRCLGSVI